MCGIVGYIGKSRKTKFIINRLELLEYRGYDSAGYASLTESGFISKKEVGSISNLESKIIETEEASVAIAHTRWATHGKVTVENCHPHFSNGEEWAVVHNGIIENYKELKLSLKIVPQSSTDTAVLSELLEEKKIENIFEFIDLFNRVEGSFGVVAINKNIKDCLFLAKRKSPLFASKSEDGDFLVASDPICFNKFSEEYYSFEDDEFALICNGEITFFNKKAQKIEKNSKKIKNIFDSYGKNGYSTFMEKEIFEEEELLKNQTSYYKNQKILSNFNKDFISKFNQIKLIGCGTAFHACEIGARYFQKLLKIVATADYASEYIYASPKLEDSKTLFIFISQSGETADTIEALKISKKLGGTNIVLTNVMYSTLAGLGDIILPVCAGAEIAVASTKAYVCQLSSLYMLACHLHNQISEENINYLDDILRVSEKILAFDKAIIDSFAKALYLSKDCIFIGKDMDYISAKESSLKLKETTYINASSYPSGELKHGYLALVEEDTPIIAFACEKGLSIKTINSVEEAVARGAKKIIITNSENFKNNKNSIFIDEQNELLLPILSIAPVQYLSCKISLLKGINPDKPKNLAKSVTVE